MSKKNKRGRAVELSVVLTCRAGEDAGPALDAIAAQTLGADRFEVLLVAAEDVPVAPRAYALERIACAGGNLAAAWNRAVARARGTLLLFLDARVVGDPALLATHLAGHARGSRRLALLGLTPAEHLRRLVPPAPSDGLCLDGADNALLAELRPLVAGRAYGWRRFDLAHLSIARAPLRAQRFDESAYGAGTGADLDLGSRLAAEGLELRFAEDARCAAPGERFDVDAWRADLVARGRALAAVAREREEPALVGLRLHGAWDGARLAQQAQAACEALLPAQEKLVEFLRRNDPAHLPEEERGALGRHLEKLAGASFLRGVVLAWTGSDPEPVALHGPRAGVLTSIVILSHDALAMTERCLGHLRRHADRDFPTQIVVVDNGSRDGSREWLAAQPDVELVALDENLGAPRGRNLGYARARGAWVVFMDNDALVEAGWLKRLHYHAQVSARVGCVGPLADRAAHGQAVPGAPDPGDDAAVERYATARAVEHEREFRINVLMSSFLIMLRRELLEEIGGFDPRFGPWGFEDDDLSLRVHLAGYANRVALDVYVRHLPYEGPKLARHEDLLARNWKRFVAKWGLDPQTPYGAGPDAFARLAGRRFAARELHVPFDAAEPDDERALAPAIGREPPEQRRKPAQRATRPLPRPEATTTRPLPAPAAPCPRGLELSVLVPTYGRPELARQLLALLDRQTLAPAAFEVVLVDDGSPEPIAIDASAHAYAVTLLRQDNAGPGAARNLGLAHCRAPLTLILNDDAVPAEDDLALHLAAHRELRGGDAVLGSFDFTAESRREPFVQLLDGTSLLFNYVAMRPGARHDWTFFWTCNLSLTTEALRRSGGFDAGRFREAIVEDVELGYRLQQAGHRVVYRPEARCGHAHALTAASYFRRMVRLGVNLTRMYRKHADPAVMWRPRGWALDDDALDEMQVRAERGLDGLKLALARFGSWEDDKRGQLLDDEDLRPWRERARVLGEACMHAGILLEARGNDLYRLALEGVTKGAPARVVVVGCGREEWLARSVQAVALTCGDDAAVEVVALADRAIDVAAKLLVREPGETLGTLLDRATRGAGGTDLVVLDASLSVGPDWLARLRWHAEADATVGLVGALAAGAEHGQEPLARGAAPERSHRRQRLLGGHALLVTRRALDRVGGFDPSLDSLSVAAADLSLRATLAGLKNRVALDVAPARLGPSPDEAREESWARLVRRFGHADLAAGEWRTLVALAEERSWTAAELRPPGAGPRLSLCMIARDEEDVIGRALASAAPWVDEMIVVDTGSRDRTLEIALAAGAIVHAHPWQDDFALARNQALAHASGDWILSLDADEELAPGSGELLRAVAARRTAELTAYAIEVRNRHDRDGHEEWFTSQAPRLYPRHGKVRWERPIHEQLVHAGGRLEVVPAPELALVHHGYLGAVRAAKDKEARNLRLLSRAAATAPGDAFAQYTLGQEHYVRRDWPAAIAALERAIALGRDRRDAEGFLAYAYALLTGACFESGDHARGVAVGSEGAARFEYADLLCNLAACHLARDEREAAGAAYERARALAAKPAAWSGDGAATTWRPLQGLASLAFLSGDHARALALYREAMGFAPERAHLRRRAAEAALALGEAAAALELATPLVESAPRDEDVQLLVADCLVAAGCSEVARERLRDLLAAFPGSARTRARLAEVELSLGDAEAALAPLVSGLQADPKCAPLYRALGEVLERIGRGDEARTALAVAVKLDGQLPPALQRSEAVAMAPARA